MPKQYPHLAFFFKMTSHMYYVEEVSTYIRSRDSKSKDKFFFGCAAQWGGYVV